MWLINSKTNTNEEKKIQQASLKGTISGVGKWEQPKGDILTTFSYFWFMNHVNELLLNTNEEFLKSEFILYGYIQIRKLQIQEVKSLSEATQFIDRHDEIMQFQLAFPDELLQSCCTVPHYIHALVLTGAENCCCPHSHCTLFKSLACSPWYFVFLII